ncbi:hypothetical protein PIB30_069827 [Stylosanthes scabra]|uniref:Uncharacterized protein n=1 Tax=Stylosanthes scabra TaxID=79078 RepID=A0ABU6XLS5_9FABA|nr:hypothetical protein [Stylosanthes scabra]
MQGDECNDFGRPGVGEGVCKCVCRRPGAENWRLGIGGGLHVGKEDVGCPGAQNWRLGVGVCFECAGSVCGRPSASFGRLGVSVVVQEGGVGVLGALGAGFGRLGAQLFSCTFNGCFRAKINCQL